MKRFNRAKQLCGAQASVRYPTYATDRAPTATSSTFGSVGSNSARYQFFDEYRRAVKQRVGVASLQWYSRQERHLFRHTVRGARAVNSHQFLNFRMLQLLECAPRRCVADERVKLLFRDFRFDALGVFLQRDSYCQS